MKKLMLLTAMLAVVLVATIPALAQNIQPTTAGVESATGTEPAEADELICLLPEGCNRDAGIEPAPGIEPVDSGVEPAPDYSSVEPAPGDVDPVGCSEEDSIISRASEPASVSEGTSVVPAEEPGCSYITVPGPTDGGSVDRAHEYPAA